MSKIRRMPALMGSKTEAMVLCRCRWVVLVIVLRCLYVSESCRYVLDRRDLKDNFLRFDVHLELQLTIVVFNSNAFVL